MEWPYYKDELQRHLVVINITVTRSDLVFKTEVLFLYFSYKVHSLGSINWSVNYQDINNHLKKSSIIKMTNIIHKYRHISMNWIVVVVIASLVKVVKELNTCRAYIVGLTYVWYTVHSNVTYVNNCYSKSAVTWLSVNNTSK